MANLSAKQLQQYVGKVGWLRTAEGLEVKVGIRDARMSWGQVQLQVTDQHWESDALGEDQETVRGETWVSVDRVKFQEQEETSR